MSIFRALEISGSALHVGRTRLDIIAENIANAETTRTPEGGPYRRQQVLLAPSSESQRGVRLLGVVADPSPPLRVFDPSHADANAEGYVEMPNVDIAMEMADMVIAARAYEANARALRVSREMIRDTIDLLT